VADFPPDHELAWYERWLARGTAWIYDCGAQAPFVVRCDGGAVLLIENQRFLLDQLSFGVDAGAVLILRDGHAVNASGWWRRATADEVLRARQVLKSNRKRDVWVPADAPYEHRYSVVLTGGVIEPTWRLNAPVELLEDCLPLRTE
jgi:hypothetical protein